MTPDQRAEFLKADDSMTSAHSESANEGQTQAPSIDEELELHFIAYIQKDGILYELDGAKDFPISHGDATAENFLEVIYSGRQKSQFYFIRLNKVVFIFNRKVRKLCENLLL